jgi:hypothetical protein
MIHRRGVIPIVVLLVLVVFGFALQAVRGPASATQPTTAADPTPTPDTAAAQAVIRALGAVRRAYNAGSVRRLCRAGALVDAAVVRSQHGHCESRLESLLANVPRLRFTVRDLTLQPDLATASVSTATGTGARVDLVRDGQRWLLSFSDGANPMPALAGSE